MQMPETDLLGDPIPPPLPEGQRLQDTAELIGHTIMSVFDGSSGAKDSGGLVIVTATRCWLPLAAEKGFDEDDDPGIEVDLETFVAKKSIDGFVGADELWHAGCISQGEHHALKAEETKRENEAKARRAARLRSELAELEGRPVVPAPAAAPAACMGSGA